MTLLSARNPAVARLRRLSRDARARREAGLFVIDGPVLAGEALGAGIEVVEAFVDPSRAPEALLDALAARRVPRREVGSDTLSSACDLTTSQGVALVARTASLPAPAPAGDRTSVPVVVVDGVAEPGNLGTVLRSAEAAGAGAAYVGTGSADPLSPKVVRAAAGSRFRLPVAQGDMDRLLAEAASGREVVGAAAGAGEPYDEVDLRHAALVVGNEAHGISPRVAAEVDRWVHIPVVGVESLNVAMATTVLLFESARQRRGTENRFARSAPTGQAPLR